MAPRVNSTANPATIGPAMRNASDSPARGSAATTAQPADISTSAHENHEKYDTDRSLARSP